MDYEIPNHKLLQRELHHELKRVGDEGLHDRRNLSNSQKHCFHSQVFVPGVGIQDLMFLLVLGHVEVLEGTWSMLYTRQPCVEQTSTLATGVGAGLPMTEG